MQEWRMKPGLCSLMNFHFLFITVKTSINKTQKWGEKNKNKNIKHKFHSSPQSLFPLTVPSVEINTIKKKKKSSQREEGLLAFGRWCTDASNGIRRSTGTRLYSIFLCMCGWKLFPNRLLPGFSVFSLFILLFLWLLMLWSWPTSSPFHELV